jgi:hypothetical protein
LPIADWSQMGQLFSIGNRQLAIENEECLTVVFNSV